MPSAEDILLAQIMSKPGGALLSEYTRSRSGGLPLELRAEFNLARLAKGNQSKVKPSPRMAVLQEQLRKIEDKHRQDLQVLDEMQDFIKSRARLEQEFAAGLQKLSQQFVAKRKWGAYSYKEDHDSILLVDLWRSVLGETASDAKAHSLAGERLAVLAGENFEQLKDERRALFKPMVRILASLQEDLLTLDVAVSEAQRKYNVAMKEFLSGQKKKKDATADMRKVMNSVQFARNDYLLELGCANKRYLKFRNEQFPEVADTLAQASLNSLKSFLKGYCHSLKMANGHARLDKLAHCSSLLAPELERRAFMHENRHEFPGRQLFEMEPYQGMAGETRDIMLDDQSRPVLLQIRNLMRSAVDRIDKSLADKELQLDSLFKLYTHYLQAGDAVGKSHSESMRSNMETLYADMESQATERAFLEWKIKRITDSGIDAPSMTPTDGGVPAGAASFLPGTLLNLDEAREREAMRRDPRGLFRSAQSVDGDGDSASADYVSIDGMSTTGVPYDPFGPQMRTAPPSPLPGMGMSPSSSLQNLSRSGPGSRHGAGSAADHAAKIPRPMSMFNFDDAMFDVATQPAGRERASSLDKGSPATTPSVLFGALKTSSLGSRPAATTTTTTTLQAWSSEESISDAPSPSAMASAGAAASSSSKAQQSAPLSALVAALHRQPRRGSGGSTNGDSPLKATSNGGGGATPAQTPPPLPPPPQSPAMPLSEAPPPLPPPPHSAAGSAAPPLPPPPSLPPPPTGKSLVGTALLTPPSPAASKTGGGASPTSPSAKYDLARAASRRGGTRPDVAKKLYSPGGGASAVPSPGKTTAHPALVGGHHGHHGHGPDPVVSQARRVSLEAFGDEDFDDFDSDLPPFYRVLYDYGATQEGDLSVKADEILYMLVWREDGWNLCLNGRGEHGYVPQSYMMLEDPVNQPNLPLPRIVDFMPSPSDVLGFTLLAGSPPRVGSVTRGSPAHNAGVVSGDMILEINSEPCTEMDLDTLKDMLRISAGYVRLCLVHLS